MSLLLPVVSTGIPPPGHGVLPEQVWGSVCVVQFVVQPTGIAHYVA